MKTLYRKIVVISGLFLMITSAYAKSDSLEVYLKIAVENNPTVLQRFKEYKAALQKVPQAGSLSDPQLEMGVFLSPMEVLSGKQVADIQLMQMFPWFGVLKNAKDEMSLMAQMKYEIFRDAKLQVFYDVQKSWFDLYRIRRDMVLTQQNLTLLQSIHRMAVVKFGVAGLNSKASSGSNYPSSTKNNELSGSGMNNMGGSNQVATTSMKSGMSFGGMGGNSNSGGLIEVYDLQLELTELENSLSNLQSEKAVALARFNALLNRAENTPVAIADTLIAGPLDIAYLSVSDSLFSSNPMLNMLQYEQRSLDSRFVMQKKMGLPMVGIGVKYSVIASDPMSGSAMNGRDMVMPMLSVTLPVYRKKYQAMQAETKLLKEASEENSKAMQNELRTAYLEALNQYYDAERRLKLYDKQRSYLQKSLSVNLKAYSSGGSSLSDIQTMRRRLLEFDLKYVEALTDFNTAKALVLRIVSTID
ncbi:MAG: TolC family protein [Paludibacter sp.]|nr:TolC family protein [Paludibacter sp.]